MPAAIVPGLISAAGSAIGGIAGKSAGAGDAGEANNRMNIAMKMIQDIQNAPDTAKPLLLEKYRQAGILTPDLEAAISAGPSKLAGVTTDGKGIQAQEQALAQMQQRAQGGMTAQDRAALAQAQQQAGTAGQAKQAQIMQQFKQMGQGGGSQELASRLASAQGGSNEQSQNALNIMGQSQQQALAAAAQGAGIGSGLETQQFGEQAQKASAADQMQRFNVQNQIQAQQQNVNAKNQAQAANLANQQNIYNQNTGMYNQEQQRQNQARLTDWQNQANLSAMKANAMTGSANYLQQKGQGEAQGTKDMFTGIGGAIGSAFTPQAQQAKYDTKTGNALYDPYSGKQVMNQGGPVHDFRAGGTVPGQAKVPGDSPENDTVDAKLSPGEIVIPRSMAQSSIGDKLLHLLNTHHEIKTHLEAADKKASKSKEKMARGGVVAQGFADGGQTADPYPPGVNENVRSNFTPDEAWTNYKRKQQFIPPAAPAPVDPTLAETATKFVQRMATPQAQAGYAQGGIVSGNPAQIPQKGSRQYLEYLMGQLKAPVKGYQEGGEIPAPELLDEDTNPENPNEINFKDASIVEGKRPDIKEEISVPESDSKEDEKASIKKGSEEADKAIEAANEEESPEEDKGEDESTETRKPASDKETSDKQVKTDALTEAQKARSGMAQSAEIAKWADVAGSGYSRTKRMDPSMFQGMAKLGEYPIQDYKEQIANHENDPNSKMSQIVRDYMASKGMKVPDSSSAADLFKIAPFLAKDRALIAQIAKSDAQIKSREDIAKLGRDAALKRQESANQAHIQAAKLGQEFKTSNRQQDAEAKLESDMSSSRAKRAVALAQQNSVYADNALRMFKEFPDPSKWTSSQVALFNTEIAKIAQGGVPSQVELNEMKNPTMAASWAKIVSSIQNVPVGAEQGKFIMLNKKYLDGLKKGSQDIIKDNVGNVLKSYQGKLSPDAYKNAVYRHSSILGLYTPDEERGISAVMQQKGLSRQDAIRTLIDQKLIKDTNY